MTVQSDARRSADQMTRADLLAALAWMSSTTTHWLNDYLGVRGLDPARADEIYAAADDGGTIQAQDMVRLMAPADPTRHTTASLRQALRWAGAEIVEPE